MFHPFAIAICMLVMWNEALKLRDGLPRDIPGHIPMIENFQREYYTLVSRAGLFTFAIAVAAGLGFATGPLLFLAGAALSIPLAATSVDCAINFVAAERAGRSRGLEAGAYLPSMVLLPVFPVFAGAAY